MFWNRFHKSLLFSFLVNNVPLGQTLEIILSKVYQEKKIKISIPENILRQNLYLYTKEVHLMFNDDIYIQNNGAATGSPLEPLLANIFMTPLEEEVIQTLTPYLCNWKRYVEDTHTYVNPKKFDFILTKLNFYHPNIQFTFELEKNKQIKILDVLVKRTAADKIKACVHRKEISTDSHINWNAHAPLVWKIGTLGNLVKRAKTVCSTAMLLHQEIEHLKAVFTGINE